MRVGNRDWHEEAAIGADVEPRNAIPRRRPLKEGPWRSRLERRTGGDRHRHQTAIRAHEEQLGTIAAPHGDHATTRRNGPLATGLWERLYVDFGAPRLIRHVRDPSAVR